MSITVTLSSGPARFDNISVDECVTVGELAEDYGSNLGIPANAIALVNGRAADDDTVVHDDDEIVWNKATGSKG